MTVIGNQKQEQKLNEMGDLAKQLFPQVNVLSIKGALRYGAESALRKSGYASWQEVSEKPRQTRNTFFKLLLKEAEPRLNLALQPDQVKRFMQMVEKANQKYLKG